MYESSSNKETHKLLIILFIPHMIITTKSVHVLGSKMIIASKKRALFFIASEFNLASQHDILPELLSLLQHAGAQLLLPRGCLLRHLSALDVAPCCLSGQALSCTQRAAYTCTYI